jgi:hypothetical protein
VERAFAFDVARNPGEFVDASTADRAVYARDGLEYIVGIVFRLSAFGEISRNDRCSAKQNKSYS